MTVKDAVCHKLSKNEAKKILDRLEVAVEASLKKYLFQTPYE